MQVAVRAASDSRGGACALAAVTVAAGNACAAGRQVRGCQQLRFIENNTLTRSSLLAKQASCLAWYLLFSAKQQAGSSGCLHKG